MIKKLDDALFTDDDIFINEDSNNVTFCGGEIFLKLIKIKLILIC